MEKSLMYSKWVHPSELLSFIKSIQTKNEANYRKNKFYLEKRKQKILETFELVVDKYQQEYNLQAKRIESYKNAYDNDTCTCGAPVRFIESHNFYGCTNYTDKSSYHFNFFNRTFQDAEYYLNRTPYINTNQWVNEVRSLADIDKSVSTSNVFQFLIENGKYDLSLVYCNRPTEDIVNRYKGAKKRSLIFEEEARQRLIKRHPKDKVIAQQAIKYKYFDQQEKFAICDFIVTTQDKVIIYEAKLDEMYTDEVQKEKYVELVNYIIQSKNIEFELEFKYIVKSPNGSILILED